MITFKYQPLFKTNRVWLCLLTAVLMNACKQPAKAPASKKDTIAKTEKSIIAVPAAEQSVTDTDECPRGVAEPVVKKDVFPKANFALQPDHRTGIETLTLNDGEKVTIKQLGCEYYILSFKFETSRFAADTNDVAYWANAALSLMHKVNKGIDTPLEISEALTKLSGRIEKDKSGSGDKLKLGEEIDFGGPDPRQYLTIERITKLADQRYAIELSLSYGPI